MVAGALAGFAAARLVEEFLGSYFEDLNDVTVDALQGHIVLQNLEIRKTALQHALGLPLFIKVGTIGRVEMRIPWAKLNSEPSQLILDDLFIICGPKSEAPWDSEFEEGRAFERKQATLASRTQLQPTPLRDEPKETFGSRITQAVLERLQALRAVHPAAAHSPQPRATALAPASPS